MRSLPFGPPRHDLLAKTPASRLILVAIVATLALIAALPLAARQGPTLTGRVLTPEGEPLAGVTVRASPVAGDTSPFQQPLPAVGAGSPVATAVTDATGTYRLATPAPWVYELAISAPGLTPYAGGMHPVLATRETAPPILLDDANVLTLNLAGPGIRNLAAEVPLAGATVIMDFPAHARGDVDGAVRRPRRQIFVAHGDAEGQVRIPLPPTSGDSRDPQAPRLEIRTPEHQPRALDSRIIPPLARGRAAAGAVFSVSLQRLVETRGLRLQAPDGSALSGESVDTAPRVTALDERGYPIPLLQRADGTVTTAWPVTRRPFTTPYRRVRLFATGGLYGEVTAPFLAAPRLGEVTDNADDPAAKTSPRTLTLEASPTLAGRVVDAVSGEPVKGAIVCLRKPWYCSQADTDGQFQVPRWSAELMSLAPGYQMDERRVNLSDGDRPLTLPLRPINAIDGSTPNR